jgi:tetratricopeptide (TPR) repeat protein
VSSDIELPDKLMQKYLPEERFSAALALQITPRVTAQVPLNSMGAALSLAELYQEEGRREEAIGLLQQLAEEAPDDPALKLSLCDLLYEDDDDEGVVEISRAVTNDSDVAVAVLHLKARALARRGLKDAAEETFTLCLKKTAGRDAELLKEVRYDRAAFYDQAGQASRARKEYEKLYADDPTYRDVAQRVG